MTRSSSLIPHPHMAKSQTTPACNMLKSSLDLAPSAAKELLSVSQVRRAHSSLVTSYIPLRTRQMALNAVPLNRVHRLGPIRTIFINSSKHSIAGRVPAKIYHKKAPLLIQQARSRSSSRSRSTRDKILTHLPSATSPKKLVRFNKLEVHIDPGHYSPHAPKSSPRPVLKHRSPNNEIPPIRSHESTPVTDSSAALDRIFHSLAFYVNSYISPVELDFSASPENPLYLVNNEKNEKFIDQYRKLDELQAALEEILTHGDRQLEKKHKDVRAAITRALHRMKEHQLKLYAEFVAAAKKRAALHLNDLFNHLSDQIKRFEYPSELDFPARTYDGLSLLKTEKNKTFINQFYCLNWFRGELKNIPTYGNEKLKRKYKDASTVIRRALHGLKEHQRKLQERHMNACRPYPV
ncbi:unnamed protein product [Rhizoctonia solani]|uniref:Uncharacterized protein n=1 Tax=Rhizoctonia solani TaxID=456999 RepID=A0A8H3BGX3_9AGAM|nr:unnamed protein product [Rhizoctonia solani]